MAYLDFYSNFPLNSTVINMTEKNGDENMNVDIGV